MGAVSLTINIKAIDSASAAFAKFASNTNASLGKVEKSLEAADKAAAKFSRTSQLLNTASIGVAVASTALGYGIKKAADASAGFEQSMRNVNSIAKLSEEEFQALEESVKGIAGDSKVADNVTQLANGLYDIYSSGLAGQDALDALAVASKGASAGMTDTATASNVLVAAMNAYGQKSGKDAQHIMDVMFKTVERGVVSFPQLAGSLGNVLGTAAQVNVSIEELGAGIATMTKQGIGAEESVTSLNGILMQFLSPNEKLAAVMKQYGYESGLAILKSKGLSGAMEWLSEATGGNAAQMADLLGDVRAVRGAMALTGAGTKMFAEDLAGMQGAAGSAAAALDEQAKGPLFQAKEAMKQLNNVIVAFGERWVEAFGKVAPYVSGLLILLTKFVESDFGGTFAFIASIVAVVGLALAGMLIFVGQAVIAWNALTAAQVANAAAATAAGEANALAGVEAAAGGAATGAGGLAGMGGRILAGMRGLIPGILSVVGTIAATIASIPAWVIIAIVAAVALVGVAIWQLVKHWDTVKAWFANIGDSIVGFFNSIPEKVYNAGVAVIEAFKNGISSAWGSLVSGLQNNFNLLMNILPQSMGGSSAPRGGAKAGGGRVSAGVAYTVGETGRETFIPSMNGQIIGAGAGGSGGVVTIQLVGSGLDERILKVTGDANVRIVKRFN